MATIDNCFFTNNSAVLWTISVSVDSHATILNSKFDNNCACDNSVNWQWFFSRSGVSRCGQYCHCRELHFQQQYSGIGRCNWCHKWKQGTLFLKILFSIIILLWLQVEQFSVQVLLQLHFLWQTQHLNTTVQTEGWLLHHPHSVTLKAMVFLIWKETMATN